MSNYSVLIRTFNSEKVLPFTLEELKKQTFLPSQYIFVDSGSTDGTLALFPSESIVHRYVGSEFNFSNSLNQGLQYITSEYVLILSSHTSLCKLDAIEFAISLLDSNENIGAVYFDNESLCELKYILIDKSNFDGFNGLWNPCSIIRMSLLKKRAFNPEVYSAEDQEWAKWMFFSENKSSARISGAGMDNFSRNSNLKNNSMSKRLNEHIAVAYFANRRLLHFPNLIRVAFRIIKITPGYDFKERLFNLCLLWRLICCLFVAPKYKSKYF